MPGGALTSVGIGDDAAVVAAPSGSVVAAVDMVIEGRHFRQDWSTAYDVGVKAAARSLADIAAMGAVSTALLVALAAPGSLAARWATGLAEGLASEAIRAGAGIVGGDTARAETITISVTALGDLEGRPPVLRSGARPGDVIAVSGPLGRSAAGLALLTAGIPAAPADPLSALVTAHLRPAPRYQAGPEAALLGATAMIDISDGLLADLGHIAAASHVQINLKTPAIRTAAGSRPAPFTPDQWLAFALTGGEDHSLVAAFPPETPLPPHWHHIGGVTTGETEVLVDGHPWSTTPGWDHFR